MVDTKNAGIKSHSSGPALHGAVLGEGTYGRALVRLPCRSWTILPFGVAAMHRGHAGIKLLIGFCARSAPRAGVRVSAASSALDTWRSKGFQ